MRQKKVGKGLFCFFNIVKYSLHASNSCAVSLEFFLLLNIVDAPNCFAVLKISSSLVLTITSKKILDFNASFIG